MSISNILTKESSIKFIIPCAGKMFRSSISRKSKALCLVLNKGYFETSSLVDMVNLKSSMREQSYIKQVGGIDKILLKDDTVCYRQRIFFNNLSEFCEFCKIECINIVFSEDFKVSINNVINCVDNLRFLEYYAKKQCETIDTFLTNSCIIHLYIMLVSKGVLVSFEDKVEGILRGRLGYLDRAPFLVAKYSIDNHTSAIFVPKMVTDERIYTEGDLNDISKYGYTSRIVVKDRKAKVFVDGYVS